MSLMKLVKILQHRDGVVDLRHGVHERTRRVAPAAVAAAAGVPKPSAISLLPSAGAAAPKPARKKKEAWQLELLTAAYAISKDTPTGTDLEQLATQTCEPNSGPCALAKIC